MEAPKSANRSAQSLTMLLGLTYVLAWFLIVATSALARPRNSLPPMPEFARVLYHESFDWIYSFGMTNAEFVVPNYGTLQESWALYALQRLGTVTPFICTCAGFHGAHQCCV